VDTLALGPLLTRPERLQRKFYGSRAPEEIAVASERRRHAVREIPWLSVSGGASTMDAASGDGARRLSVHWGACDHWAALRLCRSGGMTEFHFYMDDSGSRDPDRDRSTDPQSPDWFALGGLLVRADAAEVAKASIAAFRVRWPQMGSEPFRSYDIRNKTKRFRWLEALPREQYVAFMGELTALIAGLPIHVLACVVDRPGYNRRYMEQYGPRRWKLCRTAFNIAVERAAKVAHHHGARLRIFVERSDPKTEGQFKEYFNDMRHVGLPFDAATSQKYAPLAQATLHATLFEFRVKTKSSALMQFADLVLWPVCQGGYDATHRAYKALAQAGKLVDTLCTEANGLQGIKYSCFDGQQAQQQTVQQAR